MRFDTEGAYEFRDGALHVAAEHGGRPCTVAIDRALFEQRYGATASGDFHEYWTHLLNHRAELEAAAAARAGNAEDGRAPTIALGAGDVPG